MRVRAHSKVLLQIQVLLNYTYTSLSLCSTEELQLLKTLAVRHIFLSSVISVNSQLKPLDLYMWGQDTFKLRPVTDFVHGIQSSQVHTHKDSFCWSKHFLLLDYLPWPLCRLTASKGSCESCENVRMIWKICPLMNDFTFGCTKVHIKNLLPMCSFPSMSHCSYSGTWFPLYWLLHYFMWICVSLLTIQALHIR